MKRAAVGARPGLHRRKGRHDEQAACDCDAGKVDRESDTAQCAEEAEIAVERRARRLPQSGEAEIE